MDTTQDPRFRPTVKPGDRPLVEQQPTTPAPEEAKKEEKPDPLVLFNTLMKENNLSIRISSMDVIDVADGSIIVRKPTISVDYT